MRYLFSEPGAVLEKISGSKACLLMLDFDGTLSPISASSGKAKIHNPAKAALLELVKRKAVALAIISGRSLKDIKAKVGIKGLIYAGNHGLEWQIGKKISSVKIPKIYIKALARIRRELMQLRRRYKGVFVENKGMTLSFHYRRVNPGMQEFVKNQALSILRLYKEKKVLDAIQSKKTLDIRPGLKWTKGDFALYLAGLFTKKRAGPLVIYIGDDATDEDAFKALKKDITIRVGKKINSSAKYFIKNSRQTASFLATIATLKS